MKVFYRVTIFCFLFFIFPCFANEITLESALKKATENNRSLQLAKTALMQSSLSKQNNWNAFLPSISLSGSFTNTHGILNSSQNNNSWQAGAGLSLNLSAGIPFQMMVNNLTYDISLLDYKNAETQVLTSTTTSFYSLIAAKENINILEKSLQLAKNQYEQTKTKYSRGLASELDLLQAQYAMESAKPSLQNAKNNYEYNKASFFLTLGIEDSSSYELNGTIQIPTLNLQEKNLSDTVDSLVKEYLENRIDIQKKKLSLEKAGASKSLTVMQARTPTISLRENISLQESPTVPGMPSSSSSDLMSNGSFTASVSIPVSSFIPGSKEAQSIDMQELSVSSSLDDLEFSRKQGILEIENSYKKVLQLKEEVELSILSSNISKKSFELATQGFNSGLVSQKDLNDYQIKMTQAQTAVLSTKVNYLQALHTLASALNISIEELYTKFSAN